MARLAHASLLSIASVFCSVALGCSSSNDPATPGSTAGTTSTTTAGTGSSAGGSTSTAGTSSTSGGTGTSTAGTSSTSAGTAAGGSAAGGSAAGGSAAGGSAAGGSSSGGMFSPLCEGLTTAANEVPTKAGACTAADPQLCYKTCGPQGVGFKSETCTAGAYAEQSGCTFPDAGDYSCFKIPAAVDAACPTTTIVASTACTVKACTPCADASGSYYDSKMNLKAGYCVCPAPSMPGGTSKWSCASATSWPCPNGKGC